MELMVELRDGAPLPMHAHEGDAGLDLTSRETVTLAPGETKTVDTGVAVAIPEGYVGMVFPRSGLGSRGVNLSNCVGIIDSGFRGSIKAPLHNNHSPVDWEHPYAFGEVRLEKGKGTMTVKRGERVCQLVIVPYAKVECVEAELSETERGADGFGSTGRC